MKKLLIVIAVILLIQFNPKAKIINGYNSSLLEKEYLLNHLKKHLSESKKKKNVAMVKLTFPQKNKLKLQIDSLEKCIFYNKLTDELLNHFRLISSDLYNDIDNIVDANGYETDVYVKFVPGELMSQGQNGITIMYQKPNKKNITFSEYGKYTVSVLIAAETKPLWLLAHEFGHIKYQIPNFSKYVEFYNRSYNRERNQSKFLGHNDRDESGKIAMSYGRIYQQNYKVYRKILKQNYRYQIALIK